MAIKLEQFRDPYLDRTWEELGARVLSSGSRISVTLGYPAEGRTGQFAQELAAFLGVDDVDLEIRFAPPQGKGFGLIIIGAKL